MIAIQNIYYMLAYAFRVLRAQGEQRIATEPFEHTAELFAAILIQGVSAQVKRGLVRSYQPRMEALSVVRGKMDITASIQAQTLLRRQLICSYDVFSVDDLKNRILKSTMLLLLHADPVSAARKQQLRRLLPYFHAVGTVDLWRVDWRRVHGDRKHAACEMLVAICRMVVEGLLPSQADGVVRMKTFLDDQEMARLYEKFLLAYYRTEFPELDARAAQIAWQLDDDERTFLPVMQTDVTLSHGADVLILDAKYYAQTMTARYGRQCQHAGNLYQMFAYVKNKEEELRRNASPHKVTGMLLYARTDETTQPDATYRMSGNTICVRTLDLNQPFAEIRRQLDGIVAEFFVS